MRRLVVRSALLLALGGIFPGALAALVLNRVLAGFLFEVEPTDPVTLTGVAAILFLVALAASWVPASRASRLDPQDALRAD